MSETPKPTQKTRPLGKDKAGRPHMPVDIPVPTRKEVFDLMRSVSGDRKSAPDSGASK